MTNDNFRRGSDDSPASDIEAGDVEKGAALGGLGGAAIGAAAGAIAGPLGAVIGAVAGGLMGAGASGAAVAAVGSMDNDDTVTGVGSDATSDLVRSGVGTSGAGFNFGEAGNQFDTDRSINMSTNTNEGHNVVTGEEAQSDAGKAGLAGGALVGGTIGAAVAGPVGAIVGGVLGSLTGGAAGDASEASEEGVAADNDYSGSAYQAGGAMGTDPGTPLRGGSTVGGQAVEANDDVIAPSTQTDYRSVNNGLTSVGATDTNADMSSLGGLGTPGVRVGNDVPGMQSGGVTTAGDDTRGLMEKAADAFTGDRTDDKTGGDLLNDPARKM